MLLISLAWLGGCAKPAPEIEPVVEDWQPARLETRLEPWNPRGVEVTLPGQPPTQPVVLFDSELPAGFTSAPLSALNIENLQQGLGRIDVVAVAQSSFQDFAGETELLDHLAAVHRYSPRQREILKNWVQRGGILWVEFGVSVLGQEWIRTRNGRHPSPPSLNRFTVFGYPTQATVLRGKPRAKFVVDAVRHEFRNISRHPAMTGVARLAVTENAVATVYPVIAGVGRVLVTDGRKVYARVVPYGAGRIVSTLPFDGGDPKSDNEGFKLAVLEWLLSDQGRLRAMDKPHRPAVEH